jgi:hypothetical protein
LRSLNQHLEDPAFAIRRKDGKLSITGDTVILPEAQSIALVNLAIAGSIDNA